MQPIAKVRLRSAMLKDRAGRVNDRGWLYAPKDGTLCVPNDSGDHARPLLVCEDAKGGVEVTIVIRQEGLTFQFADGTVTVKTFAELGDEFFGF